MKRSLAYAAVLAASACLIACAASAPAAPAAAAGGMKEELDGVCKKLEANGAQWAANENLTDAADLGKIKFDKDNVSALEPILKSGKKETANLYAVNKLLGRVEQADVETVRAILPTVKALHERVHTYRTFPQISKAQAESLKMGNYAPGMSTDAMMSRMAMLEKARDAKVDKEVPIAKYNEMVYELEKHACRIMLLADDPREDALIVRTLFDQEKKVMAMFLTLAEEITTLAKDKKKMSEERARKLYPLIRPNIPRIGMQGKKNYVHPGDSTLRMDDTSTAGKREAYAGVVCIQMMNQVAAAANDKSMIPLKVPDPKDIEEALKKAAAGPK